MSAKITEARLKLLEKESFPLDARPGTRLVCVRPKAGYPSDVKQLEKFKIRRGDIVTVHHTHVGGYYTDVYLQEYPDTAFNGTHFALAFKKQTRFIGNDGKAENHTTVSEGRALPDGYVRLDKYA